MRITPIPHTQLKPSALCLGTALFGSVISREDSFALMDAFLEGGGNFLDTARVYADWLPGEKTISEKTIGLWLRERRNRDRLVLATKGAHPDWDTKAPRLARADIEFDLGESLVNLRTDTIDLYWLHRDDESRPVEEIMETLADQVRAGKIRHIGCSNWRAERIRAAQACARQQGWPGFIGDQMLWSLARMEHKDVYDKTMVVMDDPLYAYHRESGLAAMPYSSQANGWFHKHAAALAGVAPGTDTSGYGTPVNDARLARVRRLAAESGLTITQIVLGYLIGQPFTTIPIVGCKNLAQLRDSLTAGDIRLSPAQIMLLEIP
jgi:aryl-alcohol dehydrogenase-like predicted oxidoreductase